jgi:predicted ATPase
VEIVPHDDTLQIELELTDGRRFSSRVLSDGTLRILGVLALLESSRGSGLLALEEPENGVHSSRARLLTGVLRDAIGAPGDRDVEPAQIVITSHSPAVLAPLLERPEDIVCIDMVRAGAGPRFTRARRAAPDGAERSEHTVSVQELERLLAAALLDVEGGGP